MQKRFVLVYQGGIANVLRVSSFHLVDYERDAERVYQGDFRTAEAVALGMGLAGAYVISAHCNQAGDIRHKPWSVCIDDMPFSDQANPVTFR